MSGRVVVDVGLVRQLAGLARLEVPQKAEQQLAEELEKILIYVQDLSQDMVVASEVGLVSLGHEGGRRARLVVASASGSSASGARLGGASASWREDRGMVVLPGRKKSEGA